METLTSWSPPQSSVGSLKLTVMLVLLFGCFPIPQRNSRPTSLILKHIMTTLRCAKLPPKHIPNRRFKFEIEKWSNAAILWYFMLPILMVERIKHSATQENEEKLWLI